MVCNDVTRARALDSRDRECFVACVTKKVASRMSSRTNRRGGARPGAGRKKLPNSKQLGIRISEDMYDRWKALKTLRRAKSDAELFEYLLDLATATDQDSSVR